MNAVLQMNFDGESRKIKLISIPTVRYNQVDFSRPFLPWDIGGTDVLSKLIKGLCHAVFSIPTVRLPVTWRSISSKQLSIKVTYI